MKALHHTVFRCGRRKLVLKLHGHIFSIFFIQRITVTAACEASSRSLVHGKKWRAELETLHDLLSGKLLQVSAKNYVKIFV